MAAFADAPARLPDAFAVEAELDALYDALELATDAPVAAAPLPIEDAATELPNVPVEAGPGVSNSRRCWVLHDDGDVLLSDALGRDLHWRTRESFDAAWMQEIRRLSAAHRPTPGADALRIGEYAPRRIHDRDSSESTSMLIVAPTSLKPNVVRASASGMDSLSTRRSDRAPRSSARAVEGDEAIEHEVRQASGTDRRTRQLFSVTSRSTICKRR